MDILRTLEVIFGIGLVIFVHEGGHFIAARMCRVRVDVFSLGFGPRLFGWKKGDTLYQIAAIPVGGYVKMAGEMPDGSGRPPRGDELHSKNVAQRFFIYSGGVLMNIVFALIAFPIVFSVGVPVMRPIISAPTKGMPAWENGLPAGTEILAVEGERMFDFDHVYNAVALADPGPLDFTIRRPGSDQEETVRMEPRLDPTHGFYRIGVGLGYDPDLVLDVPEDRGAYEAGLRSGDRLLGVVGGLGGQSPLEQLRSAQLTGEPFAVRVDRSGAELEFPIHAEIEDRSDRRVFGFSPLRNEVRGQRDDPLLVTLGLRTGERILAVNDHLVHSPTDWLNGLLRAEGTPEIRVQGVDGHERVVSFAGPIGEAEALSLADSLHLDFDPEENLVEISEDGAAYEAGLRTGDALIAISGGTVDGWDELFKKAQKWSDSKDPVEFTYLRDGEEQKLKVASRPLELETYGFSIARASMIYKTSSVGESIKEGVSASWRFLTNAWLIIKKMAVGRVSTNNVGGIIMIGTVSYDLASQGLAKLFFFLCMLSINLAFLNVLPIPVLDGGHLFFCVVEAIKGSPVSERTLGYSQVVGLVVILTLMVYVTYQDILRLIS